MAEKELDDYIRTQKDLGVRDSDIRNSLIKAGYTSQEFEHLMERHSKKGFWKKEFSVSAKHVLFLNIGIIVVFGLMFAYMSLDYNKKLAALEASQLEALNETKAEVVQQSTSLSSLKAQSESQARSLSSQLNQTQGSMSLIRSDLESKMGNYNYQSLSRDAALQDTIQKMSNRSLSEIASFSQQLQSFSDASVDFSKVIPKAVSAVVTIGKKGTGYFQTAGSGAFINDKGYIVTNWHVIDELKPISVKTSDGKDYSATIVGKDEDWDIAVIKIDTQQTGFEYLDFADSSKVTVGEHVIAVGNPVGFESTVTEGIVSNTKRLIAGDSQSIYYIQTDVAINAGNSGGPLIDKEGKIVGIATLKYERSGFEGLSFALRSNDVQSKVLEILQEEAGI
ncbi:trypsin-like peptidase domain-containing protein [Candidatus Woesearchaeota archaeon]|nr:trypsin-like peptidase domain-containing protein [Candidatus Woesearchaeota archaeon]